MEHENIVQFIGISYDGSRDALCLVTELMDQGSLSDVIRKKGHHLSRSLKLKLAAEAAAGMFVSPIVSLPLFLPVSFLLLPSFWTPSDITLLILTLFAVKVSAALSLSLARSLCYLAYRIALQCAAILLLCYLPITRLWVLTGTVGITCTAATCCIETSRRRTSL